MSIATDKTMARPRIPQYVITRTRSGAKTRTATCATLGAIVESWSLQRPRRPQVNRSPNRREGRRQHPGVASVQSEWMGFRKLCR